MQPEPEFRPEEMLRIFAKHEVEFNAYASIVKVDKGVTRAMNKCAQMLVVCLFAEPLSSGALAVKGQAHSVEQCCFTCAVHSTDQNDWPWSLTLLTRSEVYLIAPKVESVVFKYNAVNPHALPPSED